MENGFDAPARDAERNGVITSIHDPVNPVRLLGVDAGLMSHKIDYVDYGVLGGGALNFLASCS